MHQKLEITGLGAAGCTASTARGSAGGSGLAGGSGVASGSDATGGKGGNSPAGSAM